MPVIRGVDADNEARPLRETGKGLHIIDGYLETGSGTSYQQVTGLSAVKQLTVPDWANRAWIQAESQNVRMRLDGTDPTGTEGQLILSGDVGVSLAGRDLLVAAKFIEASASAKLNVQYYK